MAKRKMAEIMWSAMRSSRKYDHPAIKQAKKWLKEADTPAKKKWADQNYYRMLHRYDRTMYEELMRNNPKRPKYYSKKHGGKRTGSLDRRSYDRKNTGRREEDTGWE
tara:strand:+ start:11011 stop:11331 length:321 start_codon:yes stop_codon:yes gene_type:complete